MGDNSKTGRRIAKIRNKKSRSQRRSRLKYQGKSTSPEEEGKTPPDRTMSVDAGTEEGLSKDLAEDAVGEYDDSEEHDSEDGKRKDPVK